ncbi:MAG: hypothetical protein JW846_05910 [Dehalococcoidia bacterium]|nr:hypothetical protein [Dehalococcoidia bacterium]
MRRLTVTAIAVLTIGGMLSAGCANGEMSEEDVERVVADIVSANSAVDTVTFDLTMNGNIDVAETDDVSQIAIVAEGRGIVDSAAEQMYMALTMNYLIPGEDTSEIPVEYYFTDGWMYINMEVPGQGGQWMKMQMPAEMWDQQNQVAQQVDMLMTADEVNFLGMEDVNGVKCYVVEIVPALETVRETMSQMKGQMSQFGGVDLSQMDLGSMMTEMSVTQYISAETYLFMRTDQHIVMEITPEALGIPASSFDRITEDLTTNVVFSDYGKPVTIQLPQGALAATEMG